MIGLLVIFILQCLLGLENLFANSRIKLIKDFGIIDYFRSFWDIRDEQYPITSPLWYLRDLIVFVVVSPIIKFLIDRTGVWYILIVFALFVFNIHAGPVSSSSLLFFSFGAFLMLNGVSDFKRHVGFYNLCISFLLFMAASISVFLNSEVRGIFVKLYICSCIPACYYISSLRNINETRLLAQITETSFFVYLFHEPWLGYIQKCFYKIVHLPDSSVVIMIYVFPVLILIISMFIYKFMKKKHSSFAWCFNWR